MERGLLQIFPFVTQYAGVDNLHFCHIMLKMEEEERQLAA